MNFDVNVFIEYKVFGLSLYGPPTSKEIDSYWSRNVSRHVRHVRAVMHVGIANTRWRGKRSRHSRRMHNPQFYVSGKRPMDMIIWHSDELFYRFKIIAFESTTTTTTTHTHTHSLSLYIYIWNSWPRAHTHIECRNEVIYLCMWMHSWFVELWLVQTTACCIFNAKPLSKLILEKYLIRNIILLPPRTVVFSSEAMFLISQQTETNSLLVWLRTEGTYASTRHQASLPSVDGRRTTNHGCQFYQT